MTPTPTSPPDASLGFGCLASDVERLMHLAASAGCETGWLATFHARLETHAKLRSAPRSSIDIDTARLFDRLGRGLLDALYSNLRLITVTADTTEAAETVLADEVRHVEQRLLRMWATLDR